MNVICAFVFMFKSLCNAVNYIGKLLNSIIVMLQASKLQFFFTIKKLRKLRMRALTSLIP